MITKTTLASILIITCIFVFFKRESIGFNHLYSNFSDSKVDPADTALKSVIDQSILEIKKKYDLHPIGIGLEGKIKGIGLEFYIHRPLFRNEARTIVLDCAGMLLSNINAADSLQPFLIDPPFKYENIGITIYSTDDNYKSFSPKYISVAGINSTGVYFKTDDPKNRFKYIEESEETFEEAAAKVEKHQAKKLTASNND